MPTYQMRAPNGRVYRVTGPAGATDEQVRAEIMRQHPDAAAAPKRTKGTGVGPLDFTLGAINEALVGGAEGITNVGAFFTDPLVGLVYGSDVKNKMQRQRRESFNAASRALSTQPMTAVRETGKIAGETAASAPILGAGGRAIAAAGGRLASSAPRVGRAVQKVGQAVQTGGIGSGRSAAQTAAMTRTARAGDLAARIAGGSIAGAGGAALTGQDIQEGAAFGAGLPVVASVLKRVAGRTVDLTKIPRQKAAQIIREALGEHTDDARAAFSALSPDDQRLARQVLVDAGVEPRTFMGLGADVERLRPDEVGRTLEAQAARRSARLAKASGGATTTERRAAAELARKDVTQATGPLREEALSRANVAGEVVPAAEQLATVARRQADELTASGIVPRMRGLEGRSLEQLDAVFQNPEMFTTGRTVQRIGEIADQAGARADAGIERQLGLRQQARDMEAVVADLAAQGMQPLQVAPIVAQLRSMAGTPGTRADKLQRTTLVRLATDLEKLADANGVIDARDLYQIRKTGLNDIVDRLLGSRAQPSSGTKERTASLLTSIRPMIDDAIEAAGGADWKDYLTRTRQGFEAVNRQELTAAAAKMAAEKPDEFVALMRGERPNIVEDIMGPGTKQYDIAGMALTDPRRYNALMKSANELATLNRMNELGRQGSRAASELAYRERPSFLTRGLTGMALFPSAPARIAAQGAEMAASGYLAPRVERELAQGFLSGQNALALLNQYPTSMGISETVSDLPPAARNLLAQSLRNYFMSSPAPDTTAGY